MNFNKVIICGNLTRDPELKYIQNGTAIARLGMAVNREWKDDSGEKQQEVCFVDVDCWGRTAENVVQYMHKGSSMLVEGRLKLEQWDDWQTGQKRSKLKVVAERVQFVGSANRTDAGDQQRNVSIRGQSQAEAPQPDANYDEDLPF